MQFTRMPSGACSLATAVVKVSRAALEAAKSMYEPTPPCRAAPEEIFTMPPPCTPWRLAILRIAALQQRNGPSKLTSNIRRVRSRSSSSTGPPLPIIPALFTSPVTGPRRSVASRNTFSTSASFATSPRTEMARPPAASISWTTDMAASSAAAKFTQTDQPRDPARRQISPPMPRLPPVTTRTLISTAPGSFQLEKYVAVLV